LVRLYRLKLLFQSLQYSSKISLLWLTLTRNCAVAMVWTHFSACALYFIAKQYSFGENDTWIGGVYTSLDPLERYLTSLYWSCVTFFTVGYGDYSPVNSAEQIWCIVYMFINTIILAYIIGSITLLIVKHDEKTGVYRETLQKLEQFAIMHHFDKGLQKRLKMAIKLNFENKEVADEQILQHFPSAVRRKVLRKLYLTSLARTSLMRGVRQQFVDEFLSTCNLEILSPGEELLQRGSVSSDLYLLVDGFVELRPVDDTKELGTSNHGGTSLSDTDHGGGAGIKHLWAGHFINESGFFTESPLTDTLRTKTVCKTLTMSRSAYKMICEDHPGSAGLILKNLLVKVHDIARESSHVSSQAIRSPACGVCL
jgi:CRP-like cAMP-binding protein